MTAVIRNVVASLPLPVAAVRLQAPAALTVDLAEMRDGGALQLPAGGTVPAVEVTVRNGARKAITKALLGGQQQTLEVTLRLWRLRAAADAPAGGPRRSAKCGATKLHVPCAIRLPRSTRPRRLGACSITLCCNTPQEEEEGEGC